MTVHDDDIGGLFKAIGGKNKQFKEFSNQSEAAHARERWPLFKTVGVEKRPPPPQLMQSEKQLWQKQAEPPPLPPLAASKTKGLTLGNKIARGLNKLAHPVSSIPAHPPINTHAHPSAQAATPPAPATVPAAARRLPPLANNQPDSLTAHSTNTAHDGAAARLQGSLPSLAGHGLQKGAAAPRKLFGTSAPAPAEAAPKAKPGSGKSRAKTKSGLFSAEAAAEPAALAAALSAELAAAPKSFGKTGRLRGIGRAIDESKTEPAAPPRKLFAATPGQAAAGKKLFGTPGLGNATAQGSRDADTRTNAREHNDNLGSLFSRLGDAAPPAGGKNRGLFNRMGKS